MFTYEGLKKQLTERGIKISELTDLIGISSRTIAKINRNEKVSEAVLKRIAEYLNTEPDKLCRELSDNIVLQVLRDEKEAKVSGGLYHELQIRMTYNSNHIEGNRLTENHTRMIFETNTIDAGDGISVDDILETVHHFRAIDYCIDNAEKTLTEDIIKELHYILKHDTKASELPWFAVGDYKKRGNMVGGQNTAKPNEVHDRVSKLLSDYNSKQNITVQNIIEFHAEFEKIHPFQDGNGRVGRLITLKECLHHNIVPFIIEDTKKTFYYRGLSQWNIEKGYLLDTCLDGQDTMIDLLKYYNIPC